MENNLTHWKELKKANLSGIGKIYLLLPISIIVIFYSLAIFSSDPWGGIFIGSFVGISTLIWIVLFRYWSPNKYNNDSEILLLKYPSGKVLKISCEQIIDIDISNDSMYCYETYIIKYFPTPTSKLDEALYVDSESGQQIEEWYNKYRSDTPEPFDARTIYD